MLKYKIITIIDKRFRNVFFILSINSFSMKKLLFFFPVLFLLFSCVKEEETPRPQKAYITEIKVSSFPTTSGGKAWDANAFNSSDTAPDMLFEFVNTDAAKTVRKSRATVKYWSNATLASLPSWTLNPKFELNSLSEKMSIDFYDDDDSILSGDDDFMGSCILDMYKETNSNSSYPKTIKIDNGAGMIITVSLEYVY